MTAVVAIADGDAAGVEQGQGAMQGRQPGGVAYNLAVEEGGEDCFEAGRIGCGHARVDVGGWIKVGLQWIRMLGYGA